MNREAVFATMVLVLCGASSWLTSWVPARRQQPRPDRPPVSGRRLEHRSWRRIWVTMLPAALALATLVGWAIQEPAVTDEPLRPLVALVALPVALVWLRCIGRACLSLRAPRRMPLIATVGIVHPRMIVAASLNQVLDPEALAAAIAHEQVHVRHRDPLRIWLAQIATDLQWPSPPARRRLQDWLAALEVARDEEARLEGAPGDALAAAVVAVARMTHATPRLAAIAPLTGAERSLLSRVRRLLQPVPADPVHASSLVAPAIVLALSGAILLGVHYGDALLRALPFIAS